jgi:hypothetical protein
LRREDRRHGGGERQKAAGGAIVFVVVLMVVVPARLAGGDVLLGVVLSIIGVLLAVMMTMAVADAAVPVRVRRLPGFHDSRVLNRQGGVLVRQRGQYAGRQRQAAQ